MTTFGQTNDTQTVQWCDTTSVPTHLPCCVAFHFTPLLRQVVRNCLPYTTPSLLCHHPYSDTPPTATTSPHTRLSNAKCRFSHVMSFAIGVHQSRTSEIGLVIIWRNRYYYSLSGIWILFQTNSCLAIYDVVVIDVSFVVSNVFVFLYCPVVSSLLWLLSVVCVC